jgi:hypothetical protein
MQALIVFFVPVNKQAQVPSIAPVAVKDEVAWSRKAGQYAQMLATLAAVRKDLVAIPRPGVRNSTHLLDLMPADTVVYAALPNLANTIAESHRVIQERISQNPALREWWEKEAVRQTTKIWIRRSKRFDSSVTISVMKLPCQLRSMANTKPDAPLVLAELKNSTGLREFMEQQVAKYSAGQTGKPDIQFVEDPSKAIASSTDGEKKEQLYVWIQNDLLAASPKLQQLQSLQQSQAGGGTSGFTGTPFHDRIAQEYSEGAESLLPRTWRRSSNRQKQNGHKVRMLISTKPL